MLSLSPATSVWTLRSEVNGGSTTTSMASSSLSFRENSSFCTRPMASRCVRFIFQLPAMSGRRAGAVTGASLSVGQDTEPGQLAALEELERGTAAGADVPVGGLVEAQLPDRGGRVTAPDDRQAVDGADGLGHAAGAGLERGELEDAHRSVPEHGAGVAQLPAEGLDGARTDVQALLIGGDLLGRDDRRLGVVG